MSQLEDKMKKNQAEFKSEKLTLIAKAESAQKELAEHKLQQAKVGQVEPTTVTEAKINAMRRQNSTLSTQVLDFEIQVKTLEAQLLEA